MTSAGESRCPCTGIAMKQPSATWRAIQMLSPVACGGRSSTANVTASAAIFLSGEESGSGSRTASDSPGPGWAAFNASLSAASRSLRVARPSVTCSETSTAARLRSSSSSSQIPRQHATTNSLSLRSLALSCRASSMGFGWEQASHSASVTASLPPEQEVHDPAPPHMLARLAAVAEDLAVVAPRLLQRVREDRQAVERPLGVDPQRQLRDGAVAPGEPGG